MKQLNSNFRIAAKQLPAALAAVQALEKDHRNLMDVDPHWVQASTMAEMLHAWHWDSAFDPITGDLTSINFAGEQLGDEETLFQALAPFVNQRSFIEMQGKDGEFWRWVFDGQQMRTQFPQGVRRHRIIWEC